MTLIPLKFHVKENKRGKPRVRGAMTAHFKTCYTPRMDFTEEHDISGVTVINADLRDKRLSGKQFCDCVFEDCDFTERDLSGGSFEDCTFRNCNFSNPLIKRTRFIGSKFEGCKLVGLNFCNCDQLSLDAGFTGCRLISCNFTDQKMKKARFIACEVNECYFQNTFLMEADFSRSSFRGTLFHACDLQKASFRSASGYCIDPRANNVRKAVFSVPEVLSLLASFEIVIGDD